MFQKKKTAKLAVLIDADNASAKDIENILNEITQYGEATVKRIYGNFVSQNGSWKQAINNLAIKPMQQFAYTTGKNATDGFMIIDAMDLLYTDRFDGFCLVSSDSDFTALAIRIKEQRGHRLWIWQETNARSLPKCLFSLHLCREPKWI